MNTGCAHCNTPIHADRAVHDPDQVAQLAGTRYASLIEPYCCAACLDVAQEQASDHASQGTAP